MKGQISLTLASVLAGGTMLISVTTSYYSTQFAVQEKITEVKVESAGNNAEFRSNIANMDERLDRLETKIDALLRNEGINPARYENINTSTSKVVE